MSRLDFLFAVLRLPIDLVSIVCAFILAYFLRAKLEFPQESLYMWPFFQYLRFVFFFLPVWVMVFAAEGLYQIRRAKNGFSELASIFLGVSTSITLMLVWLFFSRFTFFSRLVIVYAWFLAILIIAFSRFFLRVTQRYLYQKGIGLHRVVVIGTGNLAKNVADTIHDNVSFGLKVVKVIDREGIDKLEKILAKHPFEGVIVADPSLSEKETIKILEFCEDKRIIFKMIPNIFRAKLSNVEINTLASHPLIEIKKTPLEGWGKVIKRTLDLVVSLLGLVLLLPLFLVVALLIKIDSKGPVFFKHKRIGARGNPFYLYKFRSMIENADQLYPQLVRKQKKGLFFPKIEHDPRITRVGRLLRVTFIDELPQLLNVFKGEMSLVGPRPLTPTEYKQVSSYERRYSRTSYIKPGMTGLWQVSGLHQLSDWQRLQLDVYYVENWSLLLDFWILVKTPLAALKNRGDR